MTLTGERGGAPTHSVGIIVPNHNYGRYLAELVDSILALRVPAILGGALVQVTFVDDVSTDDSVAIWLDESKRLEAAGITVLTIEREVNGGSAATRNTAVAYTETDWIFPIDADDKLMPHALEEMVAKAYDDGGHRVADAVPMGYTAFGISSKGVRINPNLKRSTRLYPRHKNVVTAFLSGERLSTACSPYWREWWVRVGYNEGMRTAEDTCFWVCSGSQGATLIPSTRPCVWVRFHAKRKSFSKIRTRKNRRKDIEQALDAMPPVDFYASETHFLTHLAPMWHALPSRYRGAFHVPSGLAEKAKRLGVRYNVVGKHARAQLGLRDGTGLVVVAASGDHNRVRKAGRTSIFCEHGAGQSYTRATRHSSYAGYRHRTGVAAFLVPGPHPAQLNRMAYPHHTVYEIGCPKLDPWLDGTKVPPSNDEPVVCISFHWDCKICPETRTALSDYESHLKDLRIGLQRHGVKLIGHGHPRIHKRVAAVYKRAGIEFEPSFDRVLERADCYVIDNSSTGFEFAATKRPVVWMNAPRYRKRIKHGLRFWSAVGVGLQVDRPEELRETILEALAESDDQRAERFELLGREVYAVLDGTSAAKAAAAIVEVHGQYKKRGIPTKRVKRINNDTVTPIHQREADMANPQDFLFFQARNSSFKNAQVVALVELPTGQWQRPTNGRVAARQRFAIMNNKRGRSWAKLQKSRRLIGDTSVTFANPELPEPSSSPATDAVNNAPVPVDKETSVAASGEVVMEKVTRADGTDDDEPDEDAGTEDAGTEDAGTEDAGTEDADGSNPTNAGGGIFAEARRGAYYDFSDGTSVHGKAKAVASLQEVNNWSEEEAETHLGDLG